MMRKKLTSLYLSLFSLALFAQQNFNLELVSNFDYGPLLADVCGYVADDGTEYAIVGVFNGFSVVSLEDPANPEEVLFIPGNNSTWRDMIDYENYVFGVADVGQDGMVIIDMSGAPDSIEYKFWRPELTINNQTNFLNRCHNIYVDENGRGYLSGCNLNSGGVIIIDVATDPWNPVYLGAAPPIYSHDNFVLDNIMYSAEIYQGRFSMYDVSDPTNVITLGSQNTSSNFTHNAWPSDDNVYVFTTDEVANGYVDAYDVSDPDNIAFLSSFRPKGTEGQGVIPHNAHYHNGYVIVSWYTDGVVVIDAHRPQNMVKVGQFDTFQGNPGGFNGCWGAYPFLPSGLILASDRQKGLYVLQPDYIRASYLEGKVTSAVTGGNIPNVSVEILDDFPNGANTAASGLYKTGIPKTGTFDVRFSHPEYIEQIIEVELIAGAVTELDVEMQPLPCLPPNQQAFNFNLLDVKPDEIEIGWFRGNGDQVIVLAREGGPVNSLPEDGESYNANNEFGSGDMIGNGNYVVYIGPANSVRVTGLIEQTFYGFAILEFFNADLCYSDPPLYGNGVTASFTSDVELSKQASVGSAFPGDTVVFTFVINNNGPGEAINPTLTDSIPEELIYLFSDPAGTFQNGVFSWNTSSLANGQNITISVTTLLSHDAQPGTVINNALVEIDNNDPNPNNNSDQAEVEILCRPIHECQEDIVVYLEAGNCSIAVDFEGEGCNFSSGDFFDTGQTNVICSFINSCGEQDSCTFIITVLDTISPQIINCPVSRTITACSISELSDPEYSNTAVLSDQTIFESAINQGEADDNCSIAEYTYVDEQVTDCPFNFLRTWTITDESGNTASCVQQISIQPFSLNLICPVNFIVEVCPDELDLQFEFSDWLNTTQLNGGCDPVLVHNGDIPPPYCGGIVFVTFTATDNCGQELQCTASFTVENSDPVINCPDDLVVNVDEESCAHLNTGNTLDPLISEICGDFSLQYSITGATEGNGVQSLDGIEFNAGTTMVSWNIAGDCVNFECAFQVVVTDHISPAISCPADTTIELESGLDSIFVNLPEATAVDNCGELTIVNTYNGGGPDASDYYSAGLNVVTFSATDANGNSSHCSVKIEILLEGGFSLFTISGDIYTFTGELVSDVDMIISGNIQDTLIVNSSYSLQFIEGNDIVLQAEKADDWTEGLSTFDLVLIQRHIIQLEQLPHPYAIIAADANMDNRINAMDLVLLQNIILGNISSINGENPWIFVDASYEFENPENPLNEDWPQQITFDDLDSNYNNQNWVAIKKGDVNGSWESSNNRIVRNKFPIIASVEKGDGRNYRVNFNAGKSMDISAFQMTLEFDFFDIDIEKIDFSESVLPGFSKEWFSFSGDGKISLIWYHHAAVEISEGDNLFAFQFRKDSDYSSPDIRLTETRIPALIFGSNGEAERIVLDKTYSDQRESFVLFQNNPNPFSANTYISWYLPETMEVTIEVTDAMGRLLLTEKLDGQKGINTRKLDSDQWLGGVLFYRVSVDGWSAVRKMIFTGN